MSRRGAGMALAAAAILGGVIQRPSHAQDIGPRAALALAPPEVRFAARAADSILTTPDSGVKLEAFRGDTVTGIYLLGVLDGRSESVGYGVDPGGRRYLWFSIGPADSLEYIVMLFDVDHDLTPELLLLREVDRTARVESATEYRARSVAGQDFDITFQPACAVPRCDPSTWTVRPRETIEVSAFWFEPWRPIFGIAAMRGERWIGEPIAALPRATP